jgi:hypothetical protein
MLSKNKDHLIIEFENEIWLYLDGDLPESRLKYWNEKIDSVPGLLEILNETKQVLNIYNSSVITDVNDTEFERMLKNATARSTLMEKVRRFSSNFGLKTKDNQSNIPKIAFGGVLIIAAMVIFMMTEKPNPVKTISADVLDWDAEAISEQLLDIENSLSGVKSDKMREFILYKRTGDEWSRSVYTIEQQLDKLNKETDDKSL